MVSPRTIKIVIILALMLMLLVPLYQLSDNSPRYYKDYLVDHISKYLDHNSTQVYNNTLYQEGTESVVHQQLNVTSPCDGFPNMDGIQLVMKTGATEAFDKVPTQLLTNLQCVPDFLLFSDLVRRSSPSNVVALASRTPGSYMFVPKMVASGWRWPQSFFVLPRPEAWSHARSFLVWLLSIC